MIKKIVFLSLFSTLTLVGCKKQESLVNANQNQNPEQIEPTYAPNPSQPQSAPTPNGEAPVMAFEKTEHDFGAIGDTKKVTYVFNFTNTGKSDLLISNAVGSCGCTVPEFPKEPVKPGESGKIQVSFNPAGKNGNQQKNVTLTTNTQAGKEILVIKASITPNATSGTNSH